MEIQAPKKERKFLKSIGRIAGVLAQELVLGLGRKYIGKMINKIKIPKKRETLSFLLLLSCTFAFAQYPATGNKQRLGYQTTGDGLVFRGRSADTVSLKPSTINNAYHLFDTVNNVLFSYIKTKGGWQFNNSDTVIVNNNFSQPVDSLFFKTSVPPNNVDTAKMRWDYEKGTVVLGMYDQVPNELGFKNFWLVKNQTGSLISKGSLVYASGTLGSSGRILVSKFIANGTIEAKYLLGMTAHDLSNGEDGYVISFGKIRQVNTDTFAAGAILYPSPTVAGVWTDVEPVAPNIDLPIGFCVNSSSNNGTIAIRVASGYKLDELHDVSITSPVDKASLYYSGGLWRDTTAALLTSDTASMLTNYLRTGVAASTYLPLTGGTVSGNLTVNGTTVINELGSSSVNFRVEGDVNPWLIYADAASDEVGIGEPAPQARLDIAGNLRIQTVSTTPTSLLGKDASNIVGNVTLSSPLSLSGSALTLGTVPIANGGTGATSASAARTALGATVRGANTFTLTDIGTISFLRYNADNTVSQRAADGMRSDLGGTTIGQSMFTLTNPSAITFPRFNADNTVSALSASDFRTAIGAGTGNGNGTVTSVTGSLPISSSGGNTPNITIANAGVSTTGVVTATTQTFGGDKTFNGIVNASSDLNVTGLSTLTGGATIGTMSAQSSLTHILGVNLSNTIGEIGLNSVFSLSSGILNIQEAGSSQRGIVTSTTQSFGGNKTFTDIVGFSKAIQRPITTITGNTTIQTSNCWVIVNNTGGTTTLTLPDATLATGTELMIKTAQAQAVISASSNVVPLTFANTASTSILPATDGAWCTLVSNGTYWVIMQANF
jgi:hypothetical protein